VNQAMLRTAFTEVDNGREQIASPVMIPLRRTCTLSDMQKHLPRAGATRANLFQRLIRRLFGQLERSVFEFRKIAGRTGTSDRLVFRRADLFC